MHADDERSAAELVDAALAAGDTPQRQALLEEGVWRFGAELLDEIAGLPDEDADELDGATGVLTWWLAGGRLTERADEPDRRLAAAEEMFALHGDAVTLLGALLAVSILELPAGHGARDVARARGLLDDALRRAEDDGELDSQLRILAWKISYAVAPDLDALCDDGLKLAEACDDEDAVELLLDAVHDYYVERALEVRDAVGLLRQDPRDEQAYRAWMDRADALDERLASMRGDSVAAIFARAAEDHRNDRLAEAADGYARVVALAGELSPEVAVAARNEAQLRLQLGQPERAVAAAQPLIAPLTERYVTAVADADVAEAGDELAAASEVLAFAHAALGDFAQAQRAIDAGKSVRLRHAAALRARPEGRRVLALQRALDALARGADVDPALMPDVDEVTPQAALLEAYRQARPRLDAGPLESPDVARIASVLQAGEVAVSLGAHWAGTLAVVVGAADREQPSGHLLIEDLTLRGWIELIARRDGVGWLAALGGSDADLDARGVLGALLADVDERFGRRLRAVIGPCARRAVVIAHGLLHLVPFQALDSLADLDLVFAPSAAALVRSRARAAPAQAAARTALVVSNPTLDLRASPAECELVRTRLEALGMSVVVLADGDATQERVAEQLGGATVAHFVAHGRSQLGEAQRSALILAPSAGAASPSPQLWGAGDIAWQEEDGEPLRFADVRGVGRLYERRERDGAHAERWIERGADDAWMLCEGDEPRVRGQLWLAAEIVLGEQLRDCGMAFLAACESGVRAAGAVDEHGGLPAAFELAGARNVVATMWPVSEPVATLWADLFYAALAEQAGAGGEAIDLAAIVRASGRRMRAMTAAEATARLLALAAGAHDPWAAMSLEAFAHGLRARPFEHPWHWASFYLSGTGSVALFTKEG